MFIKPYKLLIEKRDQTFLFSIVSPFFLSENDMVLKTFHPLPECSGQLRSDK